MPIKIDKSGLLVFFVLTCVWNVIKKEGSPIYLRKKMVRESFKITRGFMAARIFSLICKGFFFF